MNMKGRLSIPDIYLYSGSGIKYIDGDILFFIRGIDVHIGLFNFIQQPLCASGLRPIQPVNQLALLKNTKSTHV
ncbi:hypothetical protein D3C80_2184510 [compost metagenome]